MDPAENSESGANPERYRRCERGGYAHDESRSLGAILRRLWAAEDAQVRRPAQMLFSAGPRAMGQTIVFDLRKNGRGSPFEDCRGFYVEYIGML